MLKLVVITLLIPVDTSECERVFSLMNDLKTSERNSLGQTTLKHIMLWWHTVAKQGALLPAGARPGHPQGVPRAGWRQGARGPQRHHTSDVRLPCEGLVK